MERGAIVEIEFTGKDVNNGRVFDTTSEKEAKEAGIYNEKARYGATSVIVGKGEVLKGLDNALLEMKIGEEREIKLDAQDAFGERKKELVVVVPFNEFKKRKIMPVPGLVVDLNGNYGRIQTVSGGRVRVDFNNELAGREVEYRVKILKELKDSKEKLKALQEKRFALPGAKAELKAKGVAEITIPAGMPKEIEVVKKEFENLVKEHIAEVKEVKFKEVDMKKEVGREDSE